MAAFLHLGGNMLYLWIFGDNVEDAMGHGRYLVFYLLGGLLASAIHIVTSPGSQIPTLGASGAIAASLGAYLILYPSSRVLSLFPLGFFLRLTMVPAIIVLGLWFVLQLFQGVLTLGGPDVGGVAFWAHIGGFVAGFVLAKLFAPEVAVRTHAALVDDSYNWLTDLLIFPILAGYTFLSLAFNESAFWAGYNQVSI
jgi:membrane associated rhomboid family serine protease